MEIIEQQIRGVYEITLKPIEDDRGFFMRSYDIEILKKAGLTTNWVQENHSKSIKKGIIRGLHFQFPPHAETKWIRCINGAVLDVFVDLRRGSESFGKYGSIHLSAERKNSVYIPKGFAHGFCTLTEVSEVLYKVDNFYAKNSEGGLLWNDPDINILWPEGEIIMSEKDKKNMTLQEFKSRYKSIEL